MKFFFNNNISFRYARMLAALDRQTVALRDELDPTTDDVEVFEYLRGTETVFVTVERRMRGRPAEIDALKAAGISALFLGPFFPKLRFWPAAEWFIRKWPMVEGFAMGARRGTCAIVQQNGKSKVIHL